MPVDPTGDVTDPDAAAAPRPAQSPVAAGRKNPPTSSGRVQSAATGGRSPAVPPKIMAAFRRYRVAAFVVGWGLLLLCAAMVLKYAFDMGAAVAIWDRSTGRSSSST